MSFKEQIEKVIEKFLDEKEYSIVDNMGFPILTDKLAQAIADRIEVDEDKLEIIIRGLLLCKAKKCIQCEDKLHCVESALIHMIVTSKADIIKLREE